MSGSPPDSSTPWAIAMSASDSGAFATGGICGGGSGGSCAVGRGMSESPFPNSAAALAAAKTASSRTFSNLAWRLAFPALISKKASFLIFIYCSSRRIRLSAKSGFLHKSCYVLRFIFRIAILCLPNLHPKTGGSPPQCTSSLQCHTRELWTQRSEKPLCNEPALKCFPSPGCRISTRRHPPPSCR